MAFLFSSSHLPASRVRRPELEDEDNDTIPLTMEMIQKYLPKGVPLITPKGKSIQINHSFFHELEKLGHGRSFDVQSKSPPFRYEFIQPKPGQPPTHHLIPAPSTEIMQFEGRGVLP